VTLWGVAAFALRVVTLRAYRRCPDCRSRVDRRAAVCRHCGYRKSG
jgi:DNA-directed RNA polymerase subunit RPC12/RpoP